MRSGALVLQFAQDDRSPPIAAVFGDLDFLGVVGLSLLDSRFEVFDIDLEPVAPPILGRVDGHFLRDREDREFANPFPAHVGALPLGRDVTLGGPLFVADDEESVIELLLGHPAAVVDDSDRGALLLPVDFDEGGVGVVGVRYQLGQDGGGVAVEVDAQRLHNRQVDCHLVGVFFGHSWPLAFAWSSMASPMAWPSGGGTAFPMSRPSVVKWTFWPGSTNR